MDEEKHFSFHRTDLRRNVQHEHKSAGINKLRQYGQNESHVIRRIPRWSIRGFLQQSGLNPDRISLEEVTNLMHESFRELEKFGIDSSLSHLIPDKNGPESIYAVAKNVTAFDATADREQEARAYEKTLNALLSYYESKKQTRLPFLSDIDRQVQYVFGTTDTDQTPHLYLIDFDPDITDDRSEELMNSITENLKNFIPTDLRTSNYRTLEERIEKLR